MTITIIGAGYVGLVTAVCLADAGFDVVCVDKDTNKIELLNKSETPFYEPGLKELMIKNKKNITFTTDLSNVSAKGRSAFGGNCHIHLRRHSAKRRRFTRYDCVLECDR